jgi:hypothetical protein
MSSTRRTHRPQRQARWAAYSYLHESKRRAKGEKVNIDVSHKRLSSGFTGEDKIWRQIVTIMDAAAGGCDLFDIDELRDFEYSPDQFDNLLMCNFIDDSASVFPLVDLQRGMVDSWVDWDDYKPFTARPFGHRPVWIGYDPSLTGDSAGCSVIALRWSLAAISAFWNVTSGVARTSPSKPRSSRKCAAGTTCSTSGSTPPAWAWASTRW